MHHNPVARVLLLLASLIGLLGINGMFIFTMATHPQAGYALFSDPITAALFIEALIVMAIFAYMIAKLKFSKISWPLFILLSFIGSLAFSIPLTLLFPNHPKS